MGEYQKAITDYAKAYYDRGITYHDPSEYEKALADLESYLGLAPPDDEPFRTQAQHLIDEMQGEQ